jgi:hypothetical protein
MLYREIIAVCSEIHTEHINTLCGQNVLQSNPGYNNNDLYDTLPVAPDILWNQLIRNS